MSIGSNIRQLRDTRNLTQEKLAEKLGVTFQAVSSWERDEYLPETANLLKLADVFDVPASAILEDKRGTFKTKETIYNWEHMKTYVKTTASALGMHNAYKAVDYAVAAHKGVVARKGLVGTQQQCRRGGHRHHAHHRQRHPPMQAATALPGRELAHHAAGHVLPFQQLPLFVECCHIVVHLFQSCLSFSFVLTSRTLMLLAVRPVCCAISS